MKTCTFFGHRECPEEIKPMLYAAIEALILTQGVERFYVGNQGQFDGYVRRALVELSKKYPHIQYAVVLAYLPGKANPAEDFSDTMLPEGIEGVHPRYAIDWRNRWMLRQADVVLTCITHTWGGAYKYAEQARKQGKLVKNLSLSPTP